MCGKKLTNHHFSSQKQANGFTLIEVLVVTTLTVLIMLASSALFMTFLIGNAKTSSTQLIKNEGSYALGQMEFLIKNAVDLQPNSEDVTCDSDMSELAIKSFDGGVTTLTAQNDPSDNDQLKIASSSATNQRFLTSSSVSVTRGPVFDCTQASDGESPYITISFDLMKGTPGIDKDRDIVTQTFTTGVAIRNF